MKLLNDKMDDLSREAMVQFGVMLQCIWASEIIAYRMSDSLRYIGAKGTLVQNKKMHLNQARRKVQSLIRDLEIAFDEDFTSIFEKDSKYTDAVSYMANDIIVLLMIYYSRGDGDDVKKDRMKQALLNFKPIEDIDLVEILKYYNFE